MQIFTDLLIEKEICKNEDREIIIHGLTAGTELILSILTTVLLGLIFDLVVESIVFLISFSFIRMYAGGYHCKKASSCYIMSSATVVLAMIIVNITPTWYMLPISLLILLVSIPIVLKLAPVSATNKPLDEVDKQHFRKIAIRNLVVECLIIVTLIITGLDTFAFVMSLGIMTTAVVVVLQKYYKS